MSLVPLCPLCSPCPFCPLFSPYPPCRLCPLCSVSLVYIVFFVSHVSPVPCFSRVPCFPLVSPVFLVFPVSLVSLMSHVFHVPCFSRVPCFSCIPFAIKKKTWNIWWHCPSFSYGAKTLMGFFAFIWQHDSFFSRTLRRSKDVSFHENKKLKHKVLLDPKIICLIFNSQLTAHWLVLNWATNLEARAPQLKCLGARRAPRKFYFADHLLGLGTQAKMLGSPKVARRSTEGLSENFS